MKTVAVVLSSLILLVLLAGCGGAAGEGASADAGRLTADYPDALPVPLQLALGSLELEETELAIDETQAAGLLPLWQAYQTLSASDTAAEAEISALINQLQDTMTAEQIEAIAAMQLTEEEVTSAMADMGTLFGRGGRQGTGDNTTGESGDSERPFGGGMMPPEGGMIVAPGGVPGEGFGGGMGGMGGGAALATRAAESGVDPEAMMAAMTNQAVVNALIRALQIKTGELDPDEMQPGRGNLAFWDVISQTTGISLETLQAETAEGATLAEAITAHGGDLEAVRAALTAAFSEAGLTGEDVAQRVEDLLNGALPGFGRQAIPTPAATSQP